MDGSQSAESLPNRGGGDGGKANGLVPQTPSALVSWIQIEGLTLHSPAYDTTV